MRRILLLGVLFCGAQAIASAQPALQADISLDRTAFFVGEPIRYQVRIRHDPKVEFILDRLDKASLEMTPFKVRDLAVVQSRQERHHLLTVTLELVTYEIAQNEWKIPPFNLYYVSGDTPARAQERVVQRFTVPAVPVAFRSSLPDNSNRIRTDLAFEDFTVPFWALLSVGLLGLLVIGSRGAHQAYQQLRRPRPEREERSAVDRRTRRAVESLLSALDQDGNAASTAAFYRDMAVILRDYSGTLSGTSGPALTAPEVQEMLVRAGEDADRARRVAELVSLADHIRYTDGAPEVANDRLDGVRSELRALFGS